MTDFDILMIGNFAKDKIIIDGFEQVMSGSGVYFGSVVIRRLGLKVAVVTRLHPADFERLDEIRAEGVQVFASPAQGTSGIANYYQSGDMERRICKPIGFGGKYEINQIPDLQARLIILSPLFAGEVDLPFLQAMARRAPVAMDIQGFVRVIVGEDLLFQPWEDMAEGLKSITYLKVDRAEAEYLTGLDEPRQAAVALADLGPSEVVLTQTSGVMAYAGGQFFEAPFNPRSLAGRTGRGDTCFCSYLAKRLDHDPQTAVNWAGVITSLKQETPGRWKGTPQQVEAILKGK